MLVTGVLTSWIVLAFPAAIVIIRGLGFIYLAWLAYRIAGSSSFDEEKLESRYSFFRCFFLQVINAKIILFTMSEISVFIIISGSGLLSILGACMVIVTIACFGMLTRAVAGAFLKKYYFQQ